MTGEQYTPHPMGGGTGTSLYSTGADLPLILMNIDGSWQGNEQLVK